MPDAPEIRSLAAAEEELENFRGTVAALDKEIARLRAEVRAARASAATGADEVTAICQRWTAQVEHMRAGIVALANRWSEPSRHARGTYFACASELLAEWDRLAFEAPPSPPSPAPGPETATAPTDLARKLVDWHNSGGSKGAPAAKDGGGSHGGEGGTTT